MVTQFDMKTVNVTLFLLCLPIPSTFQTNEQTSLIIKAVADWYGINCIVLFRSNGTGVRETDDMFRIVKFFMNDMGMMEMKDLQELNVFYRYKSDRCSKMLYVVHDRDGGSRPKLEQLSYSINLSGPVWLIFLPGTFTPREYLKNTNIPFNADFITVEMQGALNKLKQVYRVSMSHTLRITRFGYWAKDTNLVLDQYCPLYKRDDLEGKVLRVSAIENWPMTVMSDKKLGGFFGKVWQDLEERLNFSTVYVKPKDLGMGVWNGKEWNGLMGMIVKGEIDAIISEVTMTTERLDVVDFLIPLYVTRYQIFFKPPGLLIQWDLVFKPFEKEVWITLALWSCLATLFLMAFHKIAVFYGLEDSRRKSDHQYFFLVVSGFCQQANPVLPKSISCRLVVATIYFFSSVIVIIYSCTLTSMIATQKPIRPFDSLESFLQDGTYTLEQIPGSDSYIYFSNSTDHVLQEIYRTLFSKLPDEKLPKSHGSALRRVCEGKKIAHFGEYGVATVSANQISQNEGCPITVLLSFLKLLHLTMALAKDSPYRDAFNYQLFQMLNTGIISRFQSINFPLWGRLQMLSLKPVPGEQLAQVNFLFLTAVVASVCVFIAEFAKSKSNYTYDADSKRNI